MIRRFAAPLALVSAVVVYAVMFMLLPEAEPLLRVGAPALFAAIGASGVWAILARTPREIRDDTYHDDARALMAQVEHTLQRAVAESRRLKDAKLRAAVSRAATTVPALLARVAQDQPTSLYSSASTFAGHAASLLGVVEQYGDIQRHPDYYANAEQLLADGRAAIVRFDEFALESMRLVTQGDMSEYKANLATVAPPEIPKLEG